LPKLCSCIIMIEQYAEVSKGSKLFNKKKQVTLTDMGVSRSKYVDTEVSDVEAMKSFLPEPYFRTFKHFAGLGCISPLNMSECMAWLNLLDAEATGFYKQLPIWEGTADLAGHVASIEDVNFMRGTLIYPNMKKVELDEWHRIDHALNIYPFPSPLPKPEKKRQIK